MFTATSLCFNEKQAYTQEVLAVVMQNLMEITPLPTLLMRTVIQSLSLYPRLIGFVINILQRLILKQVCQFSVSLAGKIICNTVLVQTLCSVISVDFSLQSEHICVMTEVYMLSSSTSLVKVVQYMLHIPVFFLYLNFFFNFNFFKFRYEFTQSVEF